MTRESGPSLAFGLGQQVAPRQPVGYAGCVNSPTIKDARQKSDTGTLGAGALLPSVVSNLAELTPQEQAALAMADLRARWASGDHIRVEAYFSALPALAADPAIAAVVAFQEFVVAQECNAAPDVGNLLRRFPGCAEQLQRLIARWDVLTDSTWSNASSSRDLVGYEILNELGRGGMGVVYKARHRTLKRLAALKMILGGEHVSPAHRLRFLAEAQALARLNHPHIVRVYESGELDGSPYIALELIEGGNLSDHLRKTKLTDKQVAELLEVLAWGVQAAHAAGVIHRDLKPSNVLMRLDGTPIITDFGLAKDLAADAGLTNSGAVLGTPAYMAPEQAQGRTDIGPAADIYALGAMMYECLTGRPPFQGTSMELVLAQVMDKPLPPTRVRPGIAPALEAVCLKCLEKDPADRYATAGELATDLRAFLADGEVVAAVVDQEKWLAHWAKRSGFDLLGELGGRGETKVYRARQTRLRREVALKVVSASQPGRVAALEQLERQAGIASEVKRHYHKAGQAPQHLVVEVYDLGERDGLAYCAMEYIPGGSIAALVARVAPADRPARDAAELTAKAATTLATLHTFGHVHGNLSPANILIAADGSVTFTDLSPKPGRVTEDVYALGSMLYLLLTGRVPDAKHVVPPGRIRVDLPARLESICLMCLDANPSRRYQKADDVADALKAFLRETVAPTGGAVVAGDRGIPAGFTHIEPLGDTRLGRLVKARSSGGEDVTLHQIDIARLSPAAKVQLTRTLHAAAKLRHKHIHATLGIEEYGGRLTVVQEYLPGGTLTKKLATGPLTAKAAAELAGTIADAVHFAHKHGVFHGDLDPDKILFAADGTPRVTDFRLVADVENRWGAAQSGALDVQLETRAGYKPPEYLLREPIKFTPAADVYSLGALLAEMLMGVPPEHVFGTRAGLPDRKWIGLQEAASRSRRTATNSGLLARVCRRAMEWKPKKRHATAAQFATHVRGGRVGVGWLSWLLGG